MAYQGKYEVKIFLFQLSEGKKKKKKKKEKKKKKNNKIKCRHFCTLINLL